MWLEKKLAEEVSHAVACYMANEEKNAGEALHCDVIKGAAISRIRDLEEWCDDIIFSDTTPHNCDTFFILGVIQEALDFCVKGTADIPAANHRWVEAKKAFLDACPDVSF